MPFVRDLLTLGPARRDHLPAGRIALGVALPLLMLLWLGRSDLTIYASFAAFTGIYARNEPLVPRLWHQGVSALLLLACELLGLWLAHSGTGPWGVVMAGGVVAAVGAVLAAALGLRPAGALFFVFAVTGIASLPNPAPLGVALGVAASTALFCLLLGVAGAQVSGRLRPAELSAPPPHPHTETELGAHGLRHLLAASLAGLAAVLSGLGHSPWAMVAAVAPISAQDHAGQVIRALQRILGTLLGVVLAALLLALPLSPWGLALLVVGLQFLAELYVARNYSVAMVFVTPLALLMSQLGNPVPALGLLTSRAAETVIGALIGLLVVVTLRRR
ncbi:FUSC family protein [Deinococcus sonorensis]|uniref:FUSC family protein n=2 Tax=Deinococcus sonorensis TaxID=309891 RepID=A0AAU7U4P4_9DEIO